ncbi:hypothetical protein SAMN05444004_103247 [Jannaschia faecimaris]|uniref:Uncharacterized protein n=1 Tax=Jannaschia faecimaris TaxID=1244108 RepID=A0A1H3N2J0_9RHOB|nr:hypothetical protein [Jannaschia faecimaris]SDY82963.1 hypothetical protein SAMN05444004_103247 [Jannaschia faecimaris]
MWGPLITLRRKLRPLPTVAWVFLFRRVWRRRERKPLFHFALPPTGFNQDILVREPDPAKALAMAKTHGSKHLDPLGEITAMREADRRDFKDDAVISYTQRRHFGLPDPRGHI